jgi:hypothetical protein
VIEDAFASLPDSSNFSKENRQRIQSLKLLCMYIELERYGSQEMESEPQFKEVSLEEVSLRIREFQIEAQTVKDSQFICEMRLKLQDIKY